jgi:hypothetical protein
MISLPHESTPTTREFNIFVAVDRLGARCRQPDDADVGSLPAGHRDQDRLRVRRDAANMSDTFEHTAAPARRWRQIHHSGVLTLRRAAKPVTRPLLAPKR